jgi:hypothetical protein
MNFVSKSENILRNSFVLVLLLAMAAGVAVAQHKPSAPAPKVSAPKAKAPAARPSTSRPSTATHSTTNTARPGTARPGTTPGGPGLERPAGLETEQPPGMAMREVLPGELTRPQRQIDRAVPKRVEPVVWRKPGAGPHREDRCHSKVAERRASGRMGRSVLSIGMECTSSTDSTAAAESRAHVTALTS